MTVKDMVVDFIKETNPDADISKGIIDTVIFNGVVCIQIVEYDKNNREVVKYAVKLLELLAWMYGKLNEREANET